MSAREDLAAAREVCQRAVAAETAVLGIIPAGAMEASVADDLTAAGLRVVCARAAVREAKIRLSNAIGVACAPAVSRETVLASLPPRPCGEQPATLAGCERTVPAPVLGWLRGDGSLDVELASRALEYAADLQPAWAVADAITVLLDECAGAMQASPVRSLDPGLVLRHPTAALPSVSLSIARINERAKGLLIEHEWGPDVAREFLSDCPVESTEVERRLRRARAAVAERDF